MDKIKLSTGQIGNITPKFLIIISAILSTIFIFLAIYYLINIGNRYIERNKRIGVDLKLVSKIFGIIIVIYVLNVIFEKYSIIGDTVWALFTGTIVAFLINPIVTYLQSKGIKRSYGVIIVYLSALLVFSLLLVIVIPKTVQETTNLLVSLPPLIEDVGDKLISAADRINESFNYGPYNIDGKIIIENIQDSIIKNSESFQQSLLNQLKDVAAGMYSIFSKILRFILVFIFSFYFTVDKEKFKNMIIKSLPIKYKDDILYVSRRINQALLDFVKGRLLMAVFVGVATMIYLLVLGVDFAIVIGMITCIADIIPYIGPFLGFLPAVLFAFIDSPFKAMWVAILFVILQWAENNIIAPKLLSDKTGLNPMLILISIVIGGGTFGVPGMILAVPVVSMIIILIDFVRIKYNNRDMLN